MHLQQVIVFALVLGCALYVVWTLLPRPVKDRLVRRLPLAVQSRLASASPRPGTCDCSGCDQVTHREGPPQAQPLHFVPPRR